MLVESIDLSTVDGQKLNDLSYSTVVYLHVVSVCITVSFTGLFQVKVVLGRQNRPNTS